MSAEKVRRYDFIVTRKRNKVGESYAVAHPVTCVDGRYIEYADVAGLVEALELIRHSASQGVVPGNDKKRELELILNTTTQALARFQP